MRGNLRSQSYAIGENHPPFPPAATAVYHRVPRPATAAATATTPVQDDDSATIIIFPD